MTCLRRTLASLAATARQARSDLVPVVAVVAAVVVVCVVSVTAQQAVFRSQVDSVLLDVLATDRAGVISNLRPEDFEVRDNGVVQVVTHLSGEIAPLSVTLLLDTSGSLSTRELDQLRQGAAALAATMRPGDELRLMTFSQMVTLHGVVDADALARIFGRLEPLGETALNDALTLGFRLADRQASKRPVVIAFSDGADTASWMTSKNVDDAARQSWAAFFAVTPRQATTSMLNELATLSGGVVLTLGVDLAKLPDTFLQILERVRQRYLVGFTPSSNAPGWHDLDVRVKRSNVKIVARRGYLRR